MTNYRNFISQTPAIMNLKHLLTISLIWALLTPAEIFLPAEKAFMIVLALCVATACLVVRYTRSRHLLGGIIASFAGCILATGLDLLILPPNSLNPNWPILLGCTVAVCGVLSFVVSRISGRSLV